MQDDEDSTAAHGRRAAIRRSAAALLFAAGAVHFAPAIAEDSGAPVNMNLAAVASVPRAAPAPVDTWSEYPPYVPLDPTGANAASADPLRDLIEGRLPLPPQGDPGSVWDRIRAGFAMPDLETDRAERMTRWYAARADYIDRMGTRAGRYLFHIVEEIDKRGMPMELALLPFVESAMQPEAESNAKAAGLWQFIPSTGKLYALEQTLWRDERRDVIESTRAALDYLQKLYGEFNDWHLALAAYNMGEGGLARAIERNRRARRATDYSSLRIPRETQNYVPKLQAIKNIVREPSRYGIALPEIRNEPYFVVVRKARDIDVAAAAQLAEMSIEDFRALNPSFNRPVIVGAAQPTILLPAERVAVFAANLAAWEATGQPLASWTTYTLAERETIEQVAQRVGVSAEKLRDANRVPARYRLAAGSVILIPRDETMEEDIAAEHLTAALELVAGPPGMRRITYRVRSGDTLSQVSRRWSVRVQDIKEWNKLNSSRIFAGQRLTLYVAKPDGSGTKKTAARTVATARR